MHTLTPFHTRAPTQVMHNKHNKQMLTMVGGIAVLLLLLYYLVFK